MKQRTMLMAIVLFLAFVLLLSACADRKPVEQPTAPEHAAFSCSAVNAQGIYVDPFYSEADGIFYLVVPSSWNLPEVEIHYTGSVTETEKGALDQTASSISGAFAKSGDKTVLKTEDGTSVTLAVLKSDLPSVQITLSGVTLEEVHKDKDVKHRGNTVLITGNDGSVDVEALNNVEFKGRGNSTWQFYEKKGYQIKFSEETSVLGMEKAVRWVLLSNASDDSMLRSRLVYDAAKQMDMAFVPEFAYVDLWINGEYRGTYMIGEKVETVQSRLELEDPQGALFEWDDAFYGDEEYWVQNRYLGAHFVLKDSVSDNESLMKLTLEEFSGAVDQLMIYLYTTPSEKITLQDLSEMIDVDSFALYYLINEYALNKESFSTSFFWHMDGPGDVLHLGPVWDFDTCMGNDGSANSEQYGHTSLVFRYLLAVPQFHQRTQELYQQHKSVFDAMTDNVEILGKQIEGSAEINYLRWDALGEESVKQSGIRFSDSYANALNTLKTWLAGREAIFAVPPVKVATSVVSEDYGTLHIHYTDEMNHDKLRFVLWSRSSEDSGVMWYDGVKTDGEWNVDADLGFFQEAGLYQIGVYTEDAEEPIASGVNYVADVKANPHTMEVELSEDMNEATITVEDPESVCQSVHFVIWSTANNQTDLQVFNAEKISNTQWRNIIDLSGYEAEGEYNVHVFAYTGESDERINATTFVRYRIWAEGENPYLIETQINADASEVTITLTEPMGDCSLVNFLVWSSAGGQSDLQVFPAEKLENGKWQYTVDMTQFEVEGQYNVHVFGEKPYGYIKLNTAVFNVDFPNK